MRVNSVQPVFRARRWNGFFQGVSREKGKRSLRIESWDTSVLRGWGMRRLQQRRLRRASQGGRVETRGASCHGSHMKGVF